MSSRSNEKKNAITKIRAHWLSLSESERRVADWVLENAESVLYLSMSHIAQACGVSDTTVLRMCRNAGFIGFTDLKLSLAQDMTSPTQLIHENVESTDELQTIVRKVFTTNIQALYDTLEIVNEADLKKVIQLIENAGHILIVGVGGSSIVAQNFYQRLYRLGIACDAPIDVQMQIMHAALLQPGDLLVAVSYSGTTKDIDIALQEAHKHGAKTILITGNARSKLAEHADVILLSVSREIRSEPVAARIAQLTLVDSIFILYSFLHLEESIAMEKKILDSIVSKSY